MAYKYSKIKTAINISITINDNGLKSKRPANGTSTFTSYACNLTALQPRTNLSPALMYLYIILKITIFTKELEEKLKT